MQQNYDLYTAEDHKTWSILCHRQTRLVMEYACHEYKRALGKFRIDPDRIPDLDEASRELQKHCNWSLVPAVDMISPKELLLLLKKRQFPISVNIRSRNELNFSKEPDIFHDFFGHVPLLTNSTFADFLFNYAATAMTYASDEDLLQHWERFFWYTVETGLINEATGIRPFGAAIITSRTEISNAAGRTVLKEKLLIDSLVNTKFATYAVQQKYFFINSIEELTLHLEALEEFVLNRHRQKCRIAGIT